MTEEVVIGREFRRDERTPGEFTGPREGEFCETSGYHPTTPPQGNFNRPARGELIWRSSQTSAHYFLCEYCLGYFFMAASSENKWSVWRWDDDREVGPANPATPPFQATTLDALPVPLHREKRTL